MYQQLNITPIFNIPYSPQFNGIESYFSIVKSHYKKDLMKRLSTDSNIDAKKLVKAAIRAVPDSQSMACATYGRKQIEKQYELLN